jgi:hypothetical protein
MANPALSGWQDGLGELRLGSSEIGALKPSAFLRARMVHLIQH